MDISNAEENGQEDPEMEMNVDTSNQDMGNSIWIILQHSKCKVYLILSEDEDSTSSSESEALMDVDQDGQGGDDGKNITIICK